METVLGVLRDQFLVDRVGHRGEKSMNAEVQGSLPPVSPSGPAASIIISPPMEDYICKKHRGMKGDNKKSGLLQRVYHGSI